MLDGEIHLLNLDFLIFHIRHRGKWSRNLRGTANNHDYTTYIYIYLKGQAWFSFKVCSQNNLKLIETKIQLQSDHRCCMGIGSGNERAVTGDHRKVFNM